ncbi:MAG: phosphotransferase [Eubacterium sp.]|nr:phosphotransferase [Eubacterium sp.]
MLLSSFSSLTPVTKGWSSDKKYFAVRGGNEYLLRLSPMEQYDRKKQEFQYMQRAARLGIPMAMPMGFGVCEDGWDGEKGVYSLQSRVNGADAEDIIPGMSEEEQYRYGCEAGRILKQLHNIPAPDDAEEWETMFNRKIDRKIEMYTNCPLKYENGELFIKYANENRRLLKGRPQSMQHGDYHIGNMMIEDGGRLVIIDFNRFEWGDPWEEFNRIVWCAQSTPRFASGMVDGYFDGDVPEEFWRLLALYISSNTLSSLPWAIPFGQGEIDTMINQANDVLSWYDGMTRIVPTWYQER